MTDTFTKDEAIKLLKLDATRRAGGILDQLVRDVELLELSEDDYGYIHELALNNETFMIE